MFTKLGRDEVFMAPHMHLGVLARSTQGRVQGGAKIGLRVPFFKKLLLETGRLQQQTECIAMIKKHVYGGWFVPFRLFVISRRHNEGAIMTSFFSAPKFYRFLEFAVKLNIVVGVILVCMVYCDPLSGFHIPIPRFCVKYWIFSYPLYSLSWCTLPVSRRVIQKVK